jgi:predicted O-methyltransferase YrrM
MMELESRFTEPREDCPKPQRWHSPDSDSTELEVSRLVAAFVGALRPDLVVETGTAYGQTAQLIGEVLGDTEEGFLVSFETDAARVDHSRELVMGLPVSIEQKTSLDGIADLAQTAVEKVGFAWLDSLFELRIPELTAIRPLLSKGAIVGIHDCGEPGFTKYPAFAKEVADAAKKLGFNRISLPTPRGVTFLQWRG